ncbi:MAG: NAD(P)/FAD-dependent oxidoreductase [Anaerolineaceae bacterium]|nr:NAD(P)/FAD-dependent oxidoreductase [Anaerolineaceae bacterium]
MNPDAIVVGAGPNGLAAAIALAQGGLQVRVYEAQAEIGGGLRSADLTLPGFTHDHCSAVHPLALASPFLRALPLARHGLEWVQPPLPLAHPLDGGRALTLQRSLAATAAALGRDGNTWRRLFGPLVRQHDALFEEVLAPLHRPRRPLLLARFGLPGLLPAATLARSLLRSGEARALLAGNAAHGVLPLERAPSGAFGLLLVALAHSVGWPSPRGGAQALAQALGSHLRSLGGEIVTGEEVVNVDDLPPARAYLFDVTPRQLTRLAGNRLPPRFRRALARYRYGPGVFKLDYALAAPIPWAAAECRRAGTLHLGGSSDDIAASLRRVWRGQVSERPFVILGQQSLFDDTRAPEGQHTAWAYCHVPHGSAVDMTARIEAQIERFAPGFRERVLAQHSLNAPQLEAHNPNLVGGDIGGGVQDLAQHFARPVYPLAPYATPAADIWLCSSSTPPGGGVHGMCGWHAAQAVLKRLGVKA